MSKKKSPFRKGISKASALQREFTEEFDVRGDKINDLSWYSSKTQELGVAATTNFLVRAGRKTDFGPSGLRNHAFPGICSIFLSPAYGINRSSVDPANVCAQNLYTYVRSANSGARNYDAVDLFIYYGAVTQLYSWISYVKRVLHALDKYDAQNQFIPQGLVKAMNFDYDDLRAHQASLEIYINNVITRAASLAIPGDIDAIRRSIWIYENAYWDDSSTQSQLFIFNPRTVLQYALDDDGAGCLKEISGIKYKEDVDPQDLYGNNGLVTLKMDTLDQQEVITYDANWKLRHTFLKYDDIVDVTEKLLSQIFYDQDIAIMSGDVLKAYGPERLFKLVPYTRGEVWNPIYDEVALSMIENTTLTGPLNNVVLKQSQNKAYLEYDPYILLPREAASSAYLGKRMLNFHKSHPTEGDVIEATRLMVSCRSYGTDPNREGRFIANLSSCGAEIAEFAIEWKFYYLDNGGVYIDNVNQVITYTTPINTDAFLELGIVTASGDNLTVTKQNLTSAFAVAIQNVLNDVYEDAWPIFNIENFKHHPTILFTVASGKATVKGPHDADVYGTTEVRPSPDYVYTPVVDADVYSFVDKEWIDNLNKACVQGLFLLKF